MKIHHEKIGEMVEEHRVWLMSQGKYGKRAKFVNQILLETNFNSANLERAMFLETRLKNCSFVGANLLRSIFNRAQFESVNFHRANLKESMLQLSTHINSNFQRANLYHVNFKGAKLENATITGLNLQGSNFQHAQLVGANLSRSILNGSDLRWSNLSKAKLKDVKLKGARLQNCNLEKASLVRVNLQKAHLYEANLSGANLRAAIIVKTDLNKAYLKNVNLDGVIFDRKSLSHIPDKLKAKFGHSFKFVWENEGNNSDQIHRSIEFPPEYHQAGISILNYFGAVLRKKYPEQKAKINIEQDGLKVTMVVDPLKGDPEIIERALDEYGLVVTGQMPIEEFTDDKLLALEMKQELRSAQNKIDTQRELLKIKDDHIEDFKRLLNESLQNPPPIYIDTRSMAEANISQNIQLQFAPHISLIQGDLNELKEQLPQGSAGAKTLDELRLSLDKIEKNKSPEEVAKFSAMSKFRRFLIELGNENSNLGKTIKGIKKGNELARELASYYNDIAQWCGLPQVPKPFTKQ